MEENQILAHTFPKTNSKCSENRAILKGKDRLPTIDFFFSGASLLVFFGSEYVFIANLQGFAGGLPDS